ncbi:ribosome maturation factor RimM [Sanguibacter sp. A247]|uniref:ribosome maturation factor RimM n=1 Tax=unclassified Sanguibacter TaxID=2645534 RepID=UPI003FD89A3F
MTRQRLTVARLGKPHGLRGEIALDLRTDIPDERFVDGAVFETVPPGAGPLTIEYTRSSGGRWYAAFVEIGDRTGAEEARGTELVVQVDDSDEEDAWYPHELVGLRAELEDGTLVGTVKGLELGPAHDLLVILETGGERTLVPFVRAIVPTVDVAGGRVVLTPPGGLLASDAANLEVVPPTPGSSDDEER